MAIYSHLLSLFLPLLLQSSILMRLPFIPFQTRTSFPGLFPILCILLPFSPILYIFMYIYVLLYLCYYHKVCWIHYEWPLQLTMRSLITRTTETDYTFTRLFPVTHKNLANPIIAPFQPVQQFSWCGRSESFIGNQYNTDHWKLFRFNNINCKLAVPSSQYI